MLHKLTNVTKILSNIVLVRHFRQVTHCGIDFSVNINTKDFVHFIFIIEYVAHRRQKQRTY